MPVKKSQSRVKRLLNMFNPKNPKGGMLLFALIFALGGAGYFVYSSFAASAITQYWNTSGVAHTIGYKTTNDYDVNSNYTAWRITSTRLGSSRGHYMWYGPYSRLPISNAIGHYVSACWRYDSYAPDGGSQNIATFDIRINNSYGGSKVVYSNRFPMHADGNSTSGATLPYKTYVYCSPKVSIGNIMFGGPYNIEVRVKPELIYESNVCGTCNADIGYIDILRTNYTIY